jgi:hypothetical protein
MPFEVAFDIGRLKTITGVDENSFPMLIRTISMKELLIVFPSMLIGMVLLFKQEIMYAAIPLMCAIFFCLITRKVRLSITSS